MIDPIITASLIGTGGMLASGFMGSKGGGSGPSAKDQANWAADIAAHDAKVQQRLYEEALARNEPWYQAGKGALEQLTHDTQRDGTLIRPFTMADFNADPGYQFRMDEGTKAIDRSAAARGNLLSGQTLKGLTRFGQDTASSEYQNAYNRFNADQNDRFSKLATIAGYGPASSASDTAAGQNYGTNITNIGSNSLANTSAAIANQQNQNASSYQNWGNALSGAASNLSKLWMKKGENQFSDPADVASNFKW
jgi:hypothetical protein